MSLFCIQSLYKTEQGSNAISLHCAYTSRSCSGLPLCAHTRFLSHYDQSLPLAACVSPICLYYCVYASLFGYSLTLPMLMYSLYFNVARVFYIYIYNIYILLAFIAMLNLCVYV